MQYNRRLPDGRPQKRRNWLSRQLKKRPTPMGLVITAHVLALGIALVIYALPHHVIPRTGVAVGTTSSRYGTAGAIVSIPENTPEIAGTAVVSDGAGGGTAADVEPDVGGTDYPETDNIENSSEPTTAETQPEPTTTPVGYFKDKFADHFNQDGSITQTNSLYRSGNIEVTISSDYNTTFSSQYYVADIYISDISCLQTAFAQGKYGSAYRDWPYNIAKQYLSIVTMNGDYYGTRDGGIVIRNGMLYRDEKNVNDVCVLYWDGTMRTFSPYEFNAELEMSNGAYQCWNFGPELLDDNGAALTSFNSSVGKANPRSVIGYFEPGHYCFVAIDGRSSTSKGISMKDLAVFMQDLGCKAAYNLDGGESSMLCAGTTVINKPYNGGRQMSDFIMILDQEPQV